MTFSLAERERELLKNLSAHEETVRADAHVTSIWSIRMPETRCYDTVAAVYSP